MQLRLLEIGSGVRVAVGVAVRVGDAVGVAVSVGDAVGVALGVIDGLAVGVGVGVVMPAPVGKLEIATL